MPLLLWLFLFRDFIFFQTNVINLDTILSYAAVKFFINNILNGVLPLWNPFSDGGVPFYSLAILGFFNPLMYLIAILVKGGVDYYSAYLAYLTVSFFSGAVGFYFLAEELTRDRRVAYGAYLVLLFSGVGVVMFTQLNMLLIFFPSVWFFFFLLRYVRYLKTGYLLGMTFSLMVAMTSYIPFHFLTVLFTVVLFWIGVYWKDVLPWLRGWVRFALKSAAAHLLCVLALSVAATPLVLHKISDARNEIVTPARHCSDKSFEDCYKDTMNDGSRLVPRQVNYLTRITSGYSAENLSDDALGLSLEEATKYGTLSERVNFRNLFAHLDKVSYGMEVFFYIPFFCFIVFCASAGERWDKASLVVFLSGIFIFLISVGAAFPVYPFLFKHVPYFVYFRNLFFFAIFLMPMFILLTAMQGKRFLGMIRGRPQLPGVAEAVVAPVGARQRRKIFFWISLTHFFILIFLLSARDVLPVTLLTVILSWSWWGWLLVGAGGRRSSGARWMLGVLGFLILLEPFQVFNFYSRNAKVYSCEVPKSHSNPDFSLTRPLEEMDIPCDARKFLNYIPQFWHGMLMTDGPGLIGYPGTVGRGVFFVSKHMDPISWSAYVRNKFIIYDQVVPWDEREETLPAVIEAMNNNINAVFVSNPDVALLKALAVGVEKAAPHPAAVISSLDGVDVRHFDVNSLEMTTEFGRNKFLVYTDSFNSYWQVLINGAPAKLYKANGAFKGIWLPPGRNTILLRYHPLGGTGIYIFVLIFLGCFFVFTLYELFRLRTTGKIVPDELAVCQSAAQPQSINPQSKRSPLRMAVSMAGRAVVLYLLTALLAARLGNWQLAFNQHARYALGVFSNGGFQNFHDGILYFDSIITADSKSAQGWAGLGACYFNLGRYEKSIEAFQKAVFLDQDSKRFRQMLKNAFAKRTVTTEPPLPEERIKLEFH